MQKQTLIAGAIIIILSAVTLLLNHDPDKLESVPEISLNIIDGTKIKLNSLQGKPLLVTFWATTCAICIKEMPHLVELYNDLGRTKLEIIAIAMPYDPPNLVVELSKRKNIPYPVALDINGDAVRAFGNVQVTPTSFLINSAGKVIHQKIGEINMKELRLKVKELLKSTTTIS